MLTTEIDDTGIALVTLDMPGRSMNAIDWAFAQALDGAVTALAADGRVTGVILASGKASFIAGADLGIMPGLWAEGMTAGAAAAQIRRIGDVLRRLERLGKPVIAAASGTALGGGLEVMLACHARIAARNDRALFGLPEVTLGLLPGAGGTQRLPRLIGLARALPILLGGAPMAAEAALEAGLLDALVAPEDLIPAARRMLAEGRVPAQQPWDRKGFAMPGPPIGSAEGFAAFIAANAAVAQDPGPAYPAPGAILSCLYEGLRLPIDKALVVESQYFGQLVTGQVARALIGLRFDARQRLARLGVRPEAGDAAEACTAAMAAEAARLVAGGIPAARVVNAAVAAGITLAPAPTGEPAMGAEPLPAAELHALARRLLVAGALAAAGAARAEPGHADAVDLAAVQSGFPAWTGGPLAMIDRAGAAAFAAEAEALGLAVPPALAASGGRFHTEEETA